MSQNFKKRHGVIHWLTVVLIRVLKLTVAVVLGAYLIALGFCLSKEQIKGFLTSQQLNQVEVWLTLVPYFREKSGLIIDWVAAKYFGERFWWAMAAGGPLLLIGILAILSNFWSLWLAVFDRLYNFSHCPWRKWHKLTINRNKIMKE